jgi:hypothetical protein
VPTTYDLHFLPNRRVALTLYWHSPRSVTANFKVFVHLIADDNSVLVQNDSEPAHGGRPTTGWVPGEFITDGHVINVASQVAPDACRLEVGLYDPTSGQRVAVFKDNSEQENQRVILTSAPVN